MIDVFHIIWFYIIWSIDDMICSSCNGLAAEKIGDEYVACDYCDGYGWKLEYHEYIK